MARTLNVVRYDLTRLIKWRESQQRTFDPPRLWYDDLHNWRMARLRDDGAVFATINRGLASLRGYCQWATACHLLVNCANVEKKSARNVGGAAIGYGG